MSHFTNPWRRSALRLFTAFITIYSAAAIIAPARAQTCNTNQCAVDLTPTIWLNNNMWGNPNGQYGTESVTKNSATSWSTSWNFTGAPNWNVISYPNAVLGWFYGYRDAGTGLPFQISTNTPVNVTANWTVTGTFQGDVAFDLWADATQNPAGNPDHEMMIWTKVSGVGPSMPIIATPTIDGVTWDVYHQQASWSLTAFLKHGGGNQYDLGSLNYNVMDFVNWMVSQGLLSSSEYLISVPFGVELDDTPQFPTINGTLNVTNYTVTVGSVAIPPVPTGLVATAGNAQVALTWNASSGATAYDVKRSTVSGSGYVTVSSPTVTNYTNTGLTNGTTYYFVVDAKNSAGTSANSSQVSAKPQASIPPVPTGLAATPGNAQVALTWNASTGATAYDVKRSTVSGSGYATVSSPTVTNYTNTGLTNGTTYYFVVDAKNASGTSANSSQVSATPSAGGGDTAQYNFEAGLQGWVVAGAPATAVAQSTAQHFAGTHSLAVTMNGGSGCGDVHVATPGVTGGKVITYHVWIPSGMPITQVQPYVIDHNGAWDGTGVVVTANAWNTVTLTVPAGAAMPIAWLGIQYCTNATWSGTVYLDTVSWP